MPIPQLRQIPTPLQAQMLTNKATCSALANCGAENVRVHPIIVAELKLGDVERKIFAADFVVTANDAALQDRPEAFDCVGVDCADDMLPRLVIDNAVRVSLPKPLIDIVGIGAEQANSVRDCFADKLFDRCLIGAEHNASNNIALALDRSDNWRFKPVIAASARAAFLIPMPVFVFAAHVGFIDFDDAAKLVRILFNEGSADAVRHVPSGFERPEAHVAPQLPCAHSFFGSEQQMSNLEPVAERLVGVFEYGASDNREAITVRGALLALPVPFAGLEVIDLGVAATRAVNAVRPAASLQIGFAGVLIAYWEHFIELGRSQLVDLPRLFGADHRNIPLYRKKDIALC